MTVLDEAGEPQYLIKTHEDITDRRQTESRMAHMAYHDGLTDLPNRAAFLQALSQMIDACAGSDEDSRCCRRPRRLEGSQRRVRPCGGRQAPDRGSGRIQACARGGVVARLSGDEFGLIIDGKQPQAGKALAEPTVEALPEEFVIDGKIGPHRRHHGIWYFPHNGNDAASLLANAGAVPRQGRGPRLD